MDIASILIVSGIVILCLLPVLLRSFRGFDRRADDVEHENPDAADAIRKARKQIDQGKGWYGP